MHCLRSRCSPAPAAHASPLPRLCSHRPSIGVRQEQQTYCNALIVSSAAVQAGVGVQGAQAPVSMQGYVASPLQTHEFQAGRQVKWLSSTCRPCCRGCGVMATSQAVGRLPTQACWPSCRAGVGGSAAFETAEQQRAHFKTDWHRLNVKRRLAGRAPLSEQEFEQLIENQHEVRFRFGLRSCCRWLVALHRQLSGYLLSASRVSVSAQQ